MNMMVGNIAFAIILAPIQVSFLIWDELVLGRVLCKVREPFSDIIYIIHYTTTVNVCPCQMKQLTYSETDAQIQCIMYIVYTSYEALSMLIDILYLSLYIRRTG